VVRGGCLLSRRPDAEQAHFVLIDNLIDDAPDPTSTPSAATGSDFAVLRRRITAAGLLDRRPGYYLARIGLVASAFVGGWAAFFGIGDSWWQLLIAGFLGIVSVQIALVAHDLAHRQVFRGRRASEIAGRIAGNLCIGMSYGWWMDKHTRHHANPNHEDLDPDVIPDILVWTKQQAQASRGIVRFIGRWQALFFFPLLTLEGLNLHVSAVRALRGPTMRHRGLEAALLLVNFTGFLAAPLIVLAPGRAVLFIVVHQVLFGGYLGCTFAPNHKGMPVLTGSDHLDFLRRQVLTSRNVRGSRLVDILLGGLNYQIEHHLFPNMPTPNLRRAAPMVLAYCAEIGVGYEQTGLIDSYARALRHLHQVGAPIRTARRCPDSGLSGSPTETRQPLQQQRGHRADPDEAERGAGAGQRMRLRSQHDRRTAGHRNPAGSRPRGRRPGSSQDQQSGHQVDEDQQTDDRPEGHSGR
jgi:fatty acid desaturase